MEGQGLGLIGDAAARAMACPPAAAAALAAWLPPGPVLELCCGAGGLTCALAAAGHQVLALDRDPGRLAANRANLAARGLAGRATHICADLTRPALGPSPSPPPFSSAILDPDWSPPGAPPTAWAGSLGAMEPPAGELARLALAWSARVILRLPRGVDLTPLAALGRMRPDACPAAAGRRFYWVELFAA